MEQNQGLPATFNVEAFAQGQFEGENDTRFLRLETPKEYRCVVKGPFNDPKATRLMTTDKGSLLLVVVLEVQDEEQRQRLNVSKLPDLRQSIFLDVTPQGGLDMSPYKNGALGRFRDALGLNAPGQRWSFADFVGRPVIAQADSAPNDKDPTNPYVNVTAWKRAG